ncbi:biotin--[acetyl-CoA-carboxylase] ligase [Pectinatus cerevisiiphilus]|uniref:Bifunctional ligase/repressor BirA n=1 Tax=Pectinatus cerevisiiphilus TaxID=86956 RepID=A0A4R3K1P2_9FIRM|nr:biotin--[acetyl-CoA-carboxylase] ligase [Pectinatus cerevisiiphilus]TCS75628.1 BirA family biotin operon repressor/biotin-[acetyl-CoA-carboxylase] ligase [Pectinatus cerevisiiphilus]
MRSEILTILRKAGGEYISGAYLAEKLSVSRTAIWKHICALKEEGYDIDSKSRNGYRIISSPDLLTPGEINAVLATNVFGCVIKYYKTVSSTNNAAKLLAQQDAREGTIVVSEEQGNGKGRLSRCWFSPAQKGIWCSLILRPPFLPQEAPKCTLMAAVSICKAIRSLTGVQVGIKWPNDILYNGKKLVGILTEMNAEMDRINYVIIGMGINVNVTVKDMPVEIRNTATSLLQIIGKKVSRVRLLCAILAELENEYEIIKAAGFAPILEQWKKYSVTLGQKVKVIGINETFYGKAVDIDDYGALLVDTGEKIERALAGDVSIRPAEK